MPATKKLRRSPRHASVSRLHEALACARQEAVVYTRLEGGVPAGGQAEAAMRRYHRIAEVILAITCVDPRPKQ